MTMPVKIDVSEFVQAIQLSGEQALALQKTILDKVTVSFADTWKKLALKRLKQTRQEYVRNIYVERISDTTTVVGLRGWLPNKVEQGLDPFDEKIGFESSKKKKVTEKGGWYLTIPYRMATPAAVGDSEIFSNVMPQDVYTAFKGKEPNYSLKVKDLPEQYRNLGVRKELYRRDDEKIFHSYQHKSSIYEGVTKKERNGGGSMYVSFRRVSNNSSPESWIHSGIKARALGREALETFPIESIIAEVKTNFYRNS